MTEIATIDWFGRWGTSVFSENTVIFNEHFYDLFLQSYIRDALSNMQSCTDIQQCTHHFWNS